MVAWLRLRLGPQPRGLNTWSMIPACAGSHFVTTFIFRTASLSTATPPFSRSFFILPCYQSDFTEPWCND